MLEKQEKIKKCSEESQFFPLRNVDIKLRSQDDQRWITLNGVDYDKL